MLVIGFQAASFGTNCFLIAPSAGEECVIVDPGIGVASRVAELVTEYRLRPAAVLLTHGHIDHTYSVTPVCGAHGVAAHIHGADRYRLTDALAQVDPELLFMLGQQFGKPATWKDPDDVVEFGSGVDLAMAGMTLHAIHSPGHTEGSAMFRVAGVPEQLGTDSGLSHTLVAGDVLFQGGIGRTDLPGGSDADMIASLRDTVLTQSDETLVLPGHGPATTIGRERVTNPFLQHL
ncbi:MAG: MBL fold metallo-hydrolase [Austwickia sp.]|nr:MAG: MBL fold metallo-hydrolase [Austwickia sp.]